MKTKFVVKAEFQVEPETIFKAWLSSEGHSDMTGSPAKVQPRVGGKFTAWDGYIAGKTLELDPYTRILQAWRTTEFADADPDSTIEIILESSKMGTRLTLKHSGIPATQTADYETGWEDSYFAPMRAYFSKHPRA